MPFLSAGGHRLEYEWIGPGPGDAPTLVFLHDGVGCVTTWRDFPRRLAEASGYGALVYSRAGHGRSESIPLPRSVRVMYEEAFVLGEVLAAAGVRDAILVGHSDGGSIALIHAGEGASGVRDLILIAPHVFVEEITIESIRAAGEAFERGDLRLRLERHHGGNVDTAFRGWNRVWLDPAFRSWNVEEYLPRIRVPILVIQGDADEYGTPAQVEAIAASSSGPVEVRMLAGCGHAPHREKPEETLEAALQFLGRRP
jgi:pimeloyl-ACP methyl ester carboxylesterase